MRKLVVACPECDFPLNDLATNANINNYRGWCSNCNLIYLLPSENLKTSEIITTPLSEIIANFVNNCLKKLGVLHKC